MYKTCSGHIVRAFTIITIFVFGLGAAAPPPVSAQASRYFQIATGTAAGTYFPIGTIIANAISRPRNSPACDNGGNCGVPGLIAVARTTQGSIQNIELIRKGDVESAFCQADVAFWAFHGERKFAAQGPMQDLRVIANLYPEATHVVVLKAAGFKTIADLKGWRVSLGPVGSGTAADAQIVLAAYGLDSAAVETTNLSAGAAADALRARQIDAFFAVGGAPLPAIADLAQDSEIDLLPIEGDALYSVVGEHPYFYPREIAAGTYRGVDGARLTLSIAAQWLISARVDEKLVYDIVRSLWHEGTRRKLDLGHPTGKLIRLESALEALTIPLHPGAERYYREVGAIR